MPPANDNFADAQLINPPVNGGLVSVSGTTVDSTTEPEEGNNFERSVWYYFIAPETVVGNVFRMSNANFPYYAEIHEVIGVPADLDDFFNISDFLDDLEDGGGTGDDQRAVDIVAGRRYYILVSSYNVDENEFGTFTLGIGFPVPQECLNATDYISGSGSVSIVGGAVRETQKLDGDANLAFEGLWGDLTPTLVIPGEDIADSAGFYAVEVKTKLATGSASWYVGLIRNGQPLHPGSFIDTDPGSTPVESYVTAQPFFDKLQGLANTWYLPVKPEDEIEVVVVGQGNPTSLDITEICFQRIKSATEGPAYAMLDIPDYPLGMVVGDLNTAEQSGDLHLYKTTAPTFTNASIEGGDICVTDDGTVWVAIEANPNTTSGSKFTGPYLMKWNGSSWTIVNDDIEGLGVKRNFRGSNSNSALNSAPYNVSIDTDGEDIWVAYGVDAGVAPIGGFRSQAIKVKKYDVSANSWSTIGGLISGGTPNLIRSEAGNFNRDVTIRVSPAGVPWVCFTDFDQPTVEAWRGEVSPAYIARWTGSAWDIDMLPMPPWIQLPADGPTTQASTIINGSSPTASVVTEDGESCVRDTQTTYANDTIRFTPPAGKWAFRFRVQFNKAAGLGGVSGNIYKNGTQLNAATDDFSLATSGTAPSWTYNPTQATGFYADCNGTDEIEVRIRRTGTATEVFIDEVILVEARYMITALGFGMVQANFSDNAALHYCQMVFHQFGDTGYGENPAALYQSPFVYYTEDENEEGYVAEGANASTFAVAFQYFVYSEWNGSEWELKWYRIVEDDAPDHVAITTRNDSFASTPPYGHFHEGFSFFTDGEKNYVFANLSVGQAFGFIGDQYVCLEIGEEGFVPFSEGPPGILGGFGYGNQEPGITPGNPWAHGTHARSGIKDQNGNIWLSVDTEGAAGEFEPMIHTYAKNGLGDWFAASEDNEKRGYPDLEWPNPALAMSPDGTKLYSLDEVYIYQAPAIAEGPTLGVWECTILPDHKIPLIPIGGKAVRVYPDGRIEIINSQPKKVIVDPAGNVTVTSGDSKRVEIEPSGNVRVLSV